MDWRAEQHFGYSPQPITVICRIVLQGMVQLQLPCWGTVIGLGLHSNNSTESSTMFMMGMGFHIGTTLGPTKTLVYEQFRWLIIVLNRSGLSSSSAAQAFK